MSSHRGPGQRAGLTQGAVLAACWELLRSGDAAALTMRALARRLEVAPNALYSHVANRTALIDLLLDDLLAAIPAPSRETDDPVTGLLDLMTAAYQTLTSQPALVPLYLERQGARGPYAVRLGGVMDDLLTRAGTHPAHVAQARRVLIIHTIGSAAFATSAPGSDRSLSLEQSRSTFDRSLRWLLAGATHTVDVGDGAD
jgi:AcrR family transcriptional regulator